MNVNKDESVGTNHLIKQSWLFSWCLLCKKWFKR